MTEKTIKLSKLFSHPLSLVPKEGYNMTIEIVKQEGDTRMADWEKELPPIMRERLTDVGEVTPEDKERMKELEKAKGIRGAR